MCCCRAIVAHSTASGSISADDYSGNNRPGAIPGRLFFLLYPQGRFPGFCCWVAFGGIPPPVYMPRVAF